MSKRKKRMKQALLAGAALFGATKLGLLGGKPSGSSGVVGKTPEFRKSFVKPKKINYITKKSSKIPFPRKTTLDFFLYLLNTSKIKFIPLPLQNSPT